MAEIEQDGGVATIEAPPNAEGLADPGTVVEPTVVEPTTDERPRGPDGKFLPKEPKEDAPVVAEAAKPDAPVVHDYSEVILPKDAAIDAAVLERTVAIARERGLSREQAQATVDLVNEQVVASRDALLASYQPGGAEWTKQKEAWVALRDADPALGATPEERKASIALGASVLKQYKLAHPTEAAGVDAFLDGSGLGEHPAVVKLLRWIGQSSAERPISTNTDNRGAPKTTAEIFYPKGANRTEAEVRADP